MTTVCIKQTNTMIKALKKNKKKNEVPLTECMPKETLSLGFQADLEKHRILIALKKLKKITYWVERKLFFSFDKTNLQKPQKRGLKHLLKAICSQVKKTFSPF